MKTKTSGLLNAIPDASLIFEREQGQVLYANSALLKLTSYTQSELVGKKVDDLFTDLASNHIVWDGELTSLLKRRMKDPLRVILRVQVIDFEDQWTLMTLVPEDVIRQNSPEIWANKVRGIVDLASLVSVLDTLQEALQKAVKVAAGLLDADMVCIYQADDGFTQLVKSAAYEPGIKFPDKLSYADMVKLAKPLIWTPGRRLGVEIHRFSRINNLMYLASTPLGQSGKYAAGLLIAAGMEKQPYKFLEPFLAILSAQITGIIFHFAMSENLRSAGGEQQRARIVYEAVQKRTHEGILTLDPDLNVQEINQAAQELLEYVPKDIVGHAIADVLVGPDNFLMKGFEMARRKDIAVGFKAVPLHQRSGKSFWAEIRVEPVRHKLPPKDLLAFLVFIRNVDDREQLRIKEEQLDHQSRVSKLAETFAHDMRNPINNITSALQTIAATLPPEDQMNVAAVSRTYEDCLRINSIMENFLQFARPIDPSQYKEVNMNFVMMRVIERSRNRCSSAKIQLLYDNEGKNLPRVMGDSTQLERVFSNLINNAIEAMSKTGGMLSVHAVIDKIKYNKPHLAISIADSGPGIPEEIKNHIFEPRVTTKSTGHGLGLSIVKHFVTSHHGDIHVDSFPGGSIFQVYLPIIEEA